MFKNQKKVKKISVVALSSTILAGGFVPTASFAQETKTPTTNAYTVENTATNILKVPSLPEINLNSKDQPFITNQVPNSTIQEIPPVPNYYHPNPGAMNYQLIDKFYGNSKRADTISEFTKQFLVAITPGGLIKNFWASAVASALFNTFHDKPSTRYYTTYIYQAQDAYCYYGKAVVYVYSDSSRKNLVTSKEHYSTVWK